MERNTVAAMFLIFLLWMGYILFLAPKPQPRPELVQEEVRQGETAAKKMLKTEPAAEQLLERPGQEQISRIDTVEVPVDTVVVSSDLYEYHFITRGGVITRAWLKQYPAFKPGDKRNSQSTGPVQLIPEQESRFLYTRLHLKNLERPIELGSRNFTASTKRLNLGAGRQEGSVEFVDSLRGGQEIKIVYTFRNDSYLINAELHLPGELHGSKENAVEVLLGPSIVSNEKNLDDYNDYGVVYYDKGEVIKKSLKDLSKSDWAPSGEHSILWGGVKSKYFIGTFFVPESPMASMTGTGNQETKNLEFRGMFPIPAASKPIGFSLYLGPQSYKDLTKLGYGLPKLLQYGWSIIQPFCKISLVIMLWMHEWIDNYAVVLIFFAVLVRVVFYPLTIKSTKSQIKMQQIQPLIKQLREECKDDPKELQQKTLGLYREHKVNPLGGCLPLLIQMPVFIALFWVFRLTIEFRGAEAFGWIHDLSQPDPFYILPVVMGLTTYLQQKMTPTPVDPKMKPMMYMMPVFMVFIFIKFSSGLVFYYTIFNILQIFQQIYINKRYHAPAPAPAKPAAKRPQTAAVSTGSKGKKKRAGRKK